MFHVKPLECMCGELSMVTAGSLLAVGPCGGWFMGSRWTLITEAASAARARHHGSLFPVTGSRASSTTPCGHLSHATSLNAAIAASPATFQSVDGSALAVHRTACLCRRERRALSLDPQAVDHCRTLQQTNSVA
jgi:hypothetical protein